MMMSVQALFHPGSLMSSLGRKGRKNKKSQNLLLLFFLFLTITCFVYKRGLMQIKGERVKDKAAQGYIP